jgi:patatin-like phospholipase/acyl hydrolase
MDSPIRILAVDGGGVGGIIPARVLDQLCVTYPNLIATADLVAGTSTGGLIALGLARGLTPAALCTIYQNMAGTIFGRANRRYLAVRSIRAKFDPAGLREAVLQIVGTLTLGDLNAKPVLVPLTAVRRADTNHRPAGIFLSTAFRLINSPAAERFASSKWKCVDVALATSAAPTYFPAHEVDDPAGQGKWVCWDGGIVANNPSLAAVGEILRLDLFVQNAAVRQDQRQTPDIRVLSVGTGYRDLDIDPGDWGLIQAARPVVAALLDTSVGSTAFLTRQILGKKAIRVNAPLALDYEIDDPQVVPRLDGDAINFATNSLDSIRQPDGTQENLHAWLQQYWF